MIYKEVDPPRRHFAWTDTANIFFVALFPGFFFYHYLAAAGMIPLFLGGWWSWWTIAAAACLAPLTLANSLRGQLTVIHLAAAGLCGVLVAYACWHFILGAEWQMAPHLFVGTIKLVAGLVGLFGIGALLRSDELLQRFATLSLVLMFLLIPSLIQMDALSPDWRVRRGWEGVSSYQGFATSVVFTGVLLLAIYNGFAIKVAVGVTTLIALYVIGSRSEFLGFIVVSMAFGGLDFVQQQGLRRLRGVVVIVASISSFWMLPMVQSYLPDLNKLSGGGADQLVTGFEAKPEGLAARQLEVFNLESSASWQERMVYFWKAVEDIKAHPVTGMYAAPIRNGDAMGTYAHNAIEMWREFGLLAFALYFFLCLVPVLIAAKVLFLDRRDTAMWRLTLYVGGLTLLLVIASKSIYWPLPALAWGLLAARVRWPVAVRQSEVREC